MAKKPQGPSKQHDAQYHRERREVINLLPIHDKRIPRCASKTQYRWWRIGEQVPLPGFSGFCEDCTPEYQDEMSQAGRCDHPEVLFYEGKDGLVFGSQMIFPSKKALSVVKGEIK